MNWCRSIATPDSGPARRAPAVAPRLPRPERKIKYWHCPMHPEIVRDSPRQMPDSAAWTWCRSMKRGPAPRPRLPAPGPPKERKIKYWVSPMDPGYVRDKPGKAPCGMDLVPVYEEAGEAAARAAPSPCPRPPSSPWGCRTAKVEVRPLSRDTWTVGLVTLNERSLTVVNTKVNGWVERLYVNATGDPVRKGQTLLSIYSPELVSTQEEYLLALKNLKAMEKSPIKELAEGARRLAAASRRRLQLFDITPAQIADLEQTGKVKKNLTLVSPANGIVMKRMVTQGMYVQAGMPLLEVADLSTVWVDADIYQYELPWIKVGQPVEHDPGLSARGDLPGKNRLYLSLLQGGHPHRQGAPALPQPEPQTQAGDVRLGQDQIPGDPPGGGGAHGSRAGHRPQAARVHRPGPGPLRAPGGETGGLRRRQ